MRETDDPNWVQLEREAAELYRALGYVVERDNLLRQSQIDLVASKPIGGAQAVRLAIEVKYRSSGLVPMAEVRKFLDTSRDLFSEGVVSGAILVTNTGFSRNARARIENDRRFHLATIEDLRRNLFFNDEHFRRWIRGYESSQISSRFIDVYLKPKGQLSGIPVSHITELLEIFDEGHGPPTIVIFADYGGGKTTGLERLKYLALQRFLSDSTQRIPIIFQLKTLRDFPTLDQYISACLEKEFAAQCDLVLFWSLVASSRLILLFDGFDEIAVQPTDKERSAFLATIAPLLFSPCPAVLSSRPSYFANMKEYERVVERARAAHGLSGASNPARQILGPRSEKLFDDLRAQRAQELGQHPVTLGTCDTYSVAPLDEDQIRNYIEGLIDGLARVGVKAPTDVLTFLNNVYDLSDLVTRPIILQMISETILCGAIDVYAPTNSIGPSELYEVYTELRLVDDYDRGPVRQKGLSTVQRRDFAEECAWRMNVAGTQVLTRRDAEQVAHKVAGLKSVEFSRYRRVLDKVMTDLRTCSFLTIDDGGDLRFIHKSFLEYFLASRMRRMLLQNRDLSDFARPLPNETLYFLGSMTHSTDNPKAQAVNDAIVTILQNTDRPQDGGTGRDSAIRSSMLGALFYGREVVNGVSLRGGSVPRVSRRGFSIRDSTLHDVTFDDLDIRSLSVYGSELRGCKFRGDVGALDLHDSRLNVECGRVDKLVADRCSGEIRLDKLPKTRVEVLNESRLEVNGVDSSDRLTFEASGSVLTTDEVRGIDGVLHRSTFGASATVFNSSGRVVSAFGIVLVRPQVAELSHLIESSDVSFTGQLRDCLVLVHSSVPLSIIDHWRMERCVVLGGYVSEPIGKVLEGEGTPRLGRFLPEVMFTLVRKSGSKPGRVSGVAFGGDWRRLRDEKNSQDLGTGIAKAFDQKLDDAALVLPSALSWEMLSMPVSSAFDALDLQEGEGDALLCEAADRVEDLLNRWQEAAV